MNPAQREWGKTMVQVRGLAGELGLTAGALLLNDPPRNTRLNGHHPLDVDGSRETRLPERRKRMETEKIFARRLRRQRASQTGVRW